MLPRLKNHSETVNDSIISRSRLRSEKRRRQSTRPSRKSAQKPSHTVGELIFLPPNAPEPPRAIDHATWGPVQASVTSPVVSSMRPSAISPAFPHHTLTVQLLYGLLYFAWVTRPLFG